MPHSRTTTPRVAGALALAAAIVTASACGADRAVAPVTTITSVDTAPAPARPSPAVVQPVDTASPSVGAGGTVLLRVRVRAAGGAALAGVAVRWSVTGGSVSPGESGTDASGVASARWTVGAEPGDYAASAAVAGVSGVAPARFTVRVRHHPRDSSVFGRDSTTYPVDSLDGGIGTTTTPLALVSISAGDRHTCGVTARGEGWCWGYSGYGQLGSGDFAEAAGPVRVRGGPWASIAAGFNESCGLTTSGAVYCWGWDRSGALGVGGGAAAGCGWSGEAGVGCSAVPVAVAGGRTYASVAVGGADRGTNQQLGSAFACAVTAAFAAYCWGDAYFGALGTGAQYPADNPSPVAVAGGHAFARVTAGYHHACGLTTGGAAYCWGTNFRGEIGAGPTGGATAGAGAPYLVPTRVAGGHTFRALSAGDMHTCGVTTAGEVYCWGTSYVGTLGTAAALENCGDARYPIPCTGTPVRVASAERFVDVSAGDGHTCALAEGGEVYCWGLTFALGAGEIAGEGCGTYQGFLARCVRTPVKVAGDVRFTALDAGRYHTCALAAGTGRAYCWGGGPGTAWLGVGGSWSGSARVPTRVGG